MTKRILAFALFISALAAGILFGGSISVQVGKISEAPNLTVAAQDLRLLCPGGAVNTGGSSGTTVGRFSHIGNALITGSNANETAVDFSNLNDLDDKPNSAVATRTTAGIFNWASATGSVIVARGLGEQGSTMLHAAQVQNVASPLLNGLLATACQAPSPEHWLVGGDAATGRETLLILANPSTVSVTVNLEAFSEGGQISAAGLSGISVAAQSEAIVPLSSLIPETKTFVIHAVSKSGAIAAWLQQRTVRGLLYAGADFVAPATTFDKTLAIPGILIRGTQDAAALIASNSDYADLAPVLRVFNPSDKPAKFTAQVNAVAENGFGTVIHDTVAAKSVKDFQIESLANGDYSAFISADQNITASVRLARTDKTKKPNTDFTWLQAAESFTGERQITVASAGISKLTVANANSKPAMISVNSVAYKVAGNSSVVIKVENSTKVTIRSTDLPVSANLVVDVNGAVANVTLVNYKNLGGQVAVRVR